MVSYSNTIKTFCLVLCAIAGLQFSLKAQTTTCGSGSAGTACGTGGYNYGTLKGTWNISNTVTYALNTWYVITYTASGSEQARLDFNVLAGQVVDFATISGQDAELNITPQGNTSTLWVYDNDVETSFGGYPTSNANDETGTYVFPTTGVYSVKITRNGCANLTAGTRYLAFRTRFLPCGVTPSYGSGVWNGYVYDGTDLNYLYGSLGTQTATSINANWGTGQPIASGCGAMCDADNFSTRWMMSNFYSRGYYVFSTPGNDDGRRLSNNGGSSWNIFDAWGSGAGTSTTTSFITAGTYNMVFDQRENGGGAAAVLSTCQMAGDYSFATYPTWNAYVFDNQSVAAADYNGTFTTTGSGTTLINNNFGTGQPTMVGQRCGKTMDNDYYNVRYLSNKTYSNGIYVFTGTNDDGRRLYLDGGTSPLFDNWGSSSGTTVSAPVQLNGSYNMVYDMYEITGGASAFLSECQMGGGDLSSYGSGSWNVYAYNAANYNFLVSDYRGFFTSGSANATSASFSLTDATVGSNRTGACGLGISADPSMRALLNNTFTKGIYTVVSGNDDVYRLSLNGGSTWTISGTCCGNQTTSVALNGNYNIVYQGYDTGGGGVFNAAITVDVPLAGSIASSAACGASTLTWTGGKGFYTWESSTDNVNFTTIGSIAENNTVASASSVQAFNPSVVTYYRVRSESGGTVVYSNVIAVVPVPGNDACASATNISSLPFTSAVVLNQCATDDSPASSCTGPNKNIWWRYTAATCGTITVASCPGTNFDNEIAVFTGACGSMTEVTCNDDNGPACTGTQASVSFVATAGTTYFISVGSYGPTSPTGNIQIVVTNSAPSLVAGSFTNTSETICAGGDPSIIGNTSNVAASGGVGTLTYKWQYRDNCTGAWIDIAGTNTATYDPPAGLTNTRCYQRVVTDQCGTAVATTSFGTVTVTSDPVWATNTVTPGANSTFCIGGTVTLSATVSGGLGGSVSWLRATSPGGAGTTVTSPDAPPVGGPYYYRPTYTVSGNGCNITDGTETGNITVVVDPVAPTLASASPTSGSLICIGSTIPASAITFNTFNTSGAGTCTNDYRFTVDGGIGWATYVPGTTNITAAGAGTNIIQIQSRRVCSGTACDGAGETYATIAQWSVVADLPVPTFSSATSITDTACGLYNLIPDPQTGLTFNFYNAIPPSGFITTGPSAQITSSGTYYVKTFNSSTGCTSTGYSTAQLTVTPSFTANVSTTVVDCYNGTNGQATVTLGSGGVAPYSIAWSGGTAGGGSFGTPRTGFSAGSYFVLITDAAACQTLLPFTITQPTGPIAFAAPTISQSTVGIYNINCNGGTGSISNINVSGGNGGYTYAWTPNVSSSFSASGIAAGTYNVTVTDNRGCTGSTSITLIQPNPVTFSAGVGYNCGGSTYTSCTVTVNGAGGQQSVTYPYTYSFNGGAFSTNNTFTQGSNATVNFVVKDGNGCTASGSITPTRVGTAVTATDACNAIFVSRAGSASESGTKTCPTTLENAFSLLSSSRNKIIIEGGTYSLSINQTLVLPSSVSGIVIDGGYTISGSGANVVWTKQSNNPSIFTFDPPEVSGGNNIGHKMAINATGCSNFIISDIRFTVTGITTITKVDGTNLNATTGYGKSVYGLYLNGCSNYTITRVAITAGSASAGSAGINGNIGSSGGAGASGGGGDGNNENLNYGNAAGGTSACCPGGFGGSNSWAGAFAGAGGQGNCSGGAGGAGGGDNCNTFGCSNPGAGVVGGPGLNGTNGSNGAAGGAFSFATYFVPGLRGGDGTNGTNGTGGGGGGGGGAEYGGLCNDGSGGSGGGGGGAGCAGTAGTGGYGGGSSYGIFIWNNGTGGSILDYNLTTGVAGAGGTGGTGGAGGTGGNGGTGGWNGDCNVGRGGNGGKGGNGGNGGNGGSGVAGESVAIKLASGSAVTTNSTAIPTAADPVTVDADQGCTNSVITISKGGGGNWTLPSGATIVNDLNSTTPSTGVGTNTAYIYYSSIPGSPNPQDLVTATGGTYRNYVNVRYNRNLPTFTVSNTGPCAGTPVTLTVTNDGSNPTGDPVTYEWAIVSGTTPSPPSSGVSNAITTTHIFASPGTYQVRLRVKVACCGWSIPQYVTVVVVNPPTTPTIPSGLTNLCELTSGVTYTTSSTNATSYTWTINGGTIASGGTTNSPSVDWSAYTPTTNISVTASNSCGTSASSPVLTVNLKKRPTAIAVPSTNPATFCGNTGNLVISGSAIQNAPGGNNTFTYAWSTGASTQNINVTNSTTTAAYTLTVTEGGSGCTSLPATVNVTVNPNPVAPTFTAGATSLCANGTDTYTATSTSGTVTYSIIGGTGASIDNVTGALASAGTTNFTVRATTTTSSCGSAFTDRAVTVNPNPVAPSFTVGPTSLCANATATYTATSTSGTVTYSIIGGTGATINPTTGALTSAGTTDFTVRATATTGSCGALFTDRAVTITPTTVAPTFTAGATTLCANATDTYTATTTVGTVSYSIVGGSGAAINPTTGALTSAGTANFTVRATSTGTCGGPFNTDMAVTVRPTPIGTVSVTGTNPICESSSSTVRFTGLNGTTINYTLNGSPASVNITSGGFADIPTGTLSADAVYAITGANYTDNSPGCSSTPSSSATVTVQTGPQQRSVLVTASTVCSGTPGTIQLLNSENGTVYQLYNTTDGANVGATQTGNGSTLNFSTGNLTTNKSYKIIASRNPCTSVDMNFGNVVSMFVVTNGYWKGSVSNDWFDGNNWCLGGSIPSASTDVIIPNIATTNFDPIINSTGAETRTITIDANGILTINGSLNLDVYGNWSNSGTFNRNTSTVTFKGTTNASITGASTPFEFYNLTVSKGTNTTPVLNIGSNTTVHGQFTPSNGLTKLNGGNFTLYAAPTIAATAGIEVAGGTLIPGSFGLTNNGMFTVTSGQAGVGTDLTNNSGATFTLAGGVTTVGGNVTNTAATVSATGGSLNISGNWNDASASSITYGGTTVSVVGDYTSTASTVNANSATITVGGNYANNGGSTLALGGAIVNLSGSLDNNSSTLSQTAGTLRLNTLGGSFANAVLDIDGASNLNLSGGTIIFEAANSGAGNDLVVAAGAGTKTITGGTVQFGNTTSPSAQVFKVNNAVVDFNNLVIHATNTPTVTLLDDAGIRSSGVLTLGGVLDLNQRTFNIKNSATSAITGSGYVLSEATNGNGKLAWYVGNNTGAYVYPFGNAAGASIPFTFNITTGGTQTSNGNVTVSTYPTGVDNTPWVSSVGHMNFESNGLDGTSATLDRWWVIDANNYTTKPVSNMTFKYADTDLINNTLITEANLKAQRWSATGGNLGTGGWDPPTTFGSNTSNSAANTVTVNGVTNYSPWVLHDGTSFSNSPLPIELVSFKAACDGNNVVLTWVTASEVNNDYFTVQRSIDLVNYENVTVVDGAGNSNSLLSYTAKDEYAYSGTSYYRLMQTDFDSQFEVFDPVAVVCVTDAKDVITLFPNPTSDVLNVSLSLTAADRGRIMVYNHTGQLVESMFIEPKAGSNTYQFDFSQLPQGQYFVNFLMEGKTLPTQKVIVGR